VAPSIERARPARLDAGWEALHAGRWADARTCFAAAARAQGGPRAQEGLSWAAWWLDDGPAVFAARERAFRGYRDGGDPAGAARMATWLACDELDFHGAVAVAEGWLARSRRLLAPLAPGPDHGWHAFLAGYLAHAGGDTARAGELAREAAALGRRCGVADLEMLGLALEGAVLVGGARVADGMARLDEATAVALAGAPERTGGEPSGRDGIPIARAWTCCFLVTACTTVRDYERASAWCDRIADFAERYGSRYMLAFCRAEYGAVDVWRGRWAQADALLGAAVEDFARSRPAWAGMPLPAMAELRRRQGRAADAEALLDRAGASSAAQLCRAGLALDRGDAAGAADLADRVLRQLPPERRLARAPALELLARAQAAHGAAAAAGEPLAALRELAALAGTVPLRAGADHAAGAVAAAAGEHERARALLEDAVDAFERSGGRYDAAVARGALAATLAALGRTDAAEREGAAARRAIAALRGGEEAPAITPREADVLELLSEGLTNRQIAERLVLSEHTVHRHVANILRKLDAPSRAAAVARHLR
jgi:DNA-binding NarL/FixJ family response regulator